MAVNVKGAFLLARSVIPALPSPGGAIVFTGVRSPARPVNPSVARTGAYKGVLRLFTHSLARFAAASIRVNGVAPAFVESAMRRQGLKLTATSEGMTVEQAQINRAAAIPLARQATAREVAGAFLYLASPAASYVTGTRLDVNGGLLQVRIYTTGYRPS